MCLVSRASTVLLVLVALGTAVLSFSGLSHLGRLAGFVDSLLAVPLAAVYALVIDAGALAATLAWLYGDPDDTRRTGYARRLALVLIGTSVVGMYVSHAVTTLPWWLAGAVAVVAPLELAAVIHLLAMPAHRAGDDLATTATATTETAPPLALEDMPASGGAPQPGELENRVEADLENRVEVGGEVEDHLETDLEIHPPHLVIATPAPLHLESRVEDRLEIHHPDLVTGGELEDHLETEPGDLLARGRDLVAELGKVPGRHTLRTRLDITEHQARQLAADLRKEPAA